MKGKLFFSLFILSFLALGFAKAQNIQFEDANFKKTLLSASPDSGIAKDANGDFVAIDANGDGEISQAEALNIYYLDISKTQDITSIKGIEYFTNLTVLSCNGLPKLKSLDLSKNIKLQYLDLSNVEIQILDISKNIKLQYLDLSGTGIKTLDVSKNVNLQLLGLNSTGINILDISKNINLQALNLSSTGIKTIDLSKNINLQGLYLSNTKIETLDVSKNIELQYLDLGNIGIKTLNISKNINLQYLWLTSTRIESLDLSKNINLQGLDLSNTKIQTLDVSHNIKLEFLELNDCIGLTSLYMKNGVKKTFSFEHLEGYNFNNTNLNYICCDKGEIDAVKKHMQDLGRTSNLTVTSDCETKPQEKTVSSKKTSEKL